MIDFKIERVRNTKNGIYFTILFFNKIYVNDCHIVVGQDGREWAFMPQRSYKQQDGNYKTYNVVYVKLTEQENNDVVNAVHAKLNGASVDEIQEARQNQFTEMQEDEDDLPF